MHEEHKLELKQLNTKFLFEPKKYGLLVRENNAASSTEADWLSISVYIITWHNWHLAAVLYTKCAFKMFLTGLNDLVTSKL